MVVHQLWKIALNIVYLVYLISFIVLNSQSFCPFSCLNLCHFQKSGSVSQVASDIWFSVCKSMWQLIFLFQTHIL